jgi:hypothetical protein
VPEQVPCKRHPDTSTGLRCGNCGDPICPKCMVHATVGIRCLDCGKAVALPTYQVTGLYLAKAILAAVAVGAVTGIIYAILLVWIPLVSTLALLGIGYLVAEAATAAAGRRRGRTMQYVVVGGILVALVLIFLLSPVLSIWIFVGAVAAIFVGIGRVR